MKLIDLTGRTFGRLTVLSRAEDVRWADRARVAWNCRCTCGVEKVIPGGRLKLGAESCGCLHRERITKHGMHKSGEYQSWVCMKSRCLNPNLVAYKDYGGRGIVVCARWLNSFDNFYADMGARPTLKHTLERVDVNGNYEPDNCVWATRKEQSNNRRDNRLIIARGKSQTVTQWAEEIGVSPPAIFNRLKMGESDSDAIDNLKSREMIRAENGTFLARKPT